MGGTHAQVGACLIELAEALAAAKQTKRSKEVASRALVVIRASYPAEGHAAAVFHTGEIFREAGEMETALTYFQQAAALYEPSNLNQPAFLLASLTESARLLHAQHRYVEAASALERATSSERGGGEKWNASVVSRAYLLADCYRRTGEYDKALALLDQVARSLTDIAVSGHIVAEDILLQIADLQYENGGASEALATVQRLLKRPSTERNEADTRMPSRLASWGLPALDINVLGRKPNS